MSWKVISAYILTALTLITMYQQDWAKATYLLVLTIWVVEWHDKERKG